MVVKMEKEELAIVKAFISDPCFVKVEFVQDVSLIEDTTLCINFFVVNNSLSIGQLVCVV